MRSAFLLSSPVVPNSSRRPLHQSNATKMTKATHQPLPSNKIPPKVPSSISKLWAQVNLAAPSLLSATFSSPDANTITASWCQRDVIASRKRFYSTSYIRSDNSFTTTPPQEHDRISTSRSYYSPSGRKIVRFTEKSTTDKSSSLVAEIWDTNSATLESVFSIDEKTHGALYADEWFASVAWSPDESMIAYIAESPGPRPSSSLEHDEKNKKDEQDDWITPLMKKFHDTARDPLGEAYVGQRTPALFVADLSTGNVVELAATFDGNNRAAVLFGQPQWSPDGNWIVLVMRRSADIDPSDAPELNAHLPYDLGLRYCYNRYCAIVALSAPTKVSNDIDLSLLPVRIISASDSQEDFCCISPRITPDGNYIVYVSAPRASVESTAAALPHNTTKLLRCIRIDNGTFLPPSTIIDIPEDPSIDDFPGLYLHGLPTRPWLTNRSLVFSSIWGSSVVPLLIELHESNDGLEVDKDFPKMLLDRENTLFREGEDFPYHTTTATTNATVLDVLDGRVLLSANDSVHPSRLFLWENDKPVIPISKGSEKSRQFSHFLRGAWTYDLVAREGELRQPAEEFIATKHEAHERFQSILLVPHVREGSDTKGAPLVTFPHGGPHVVSTGAFSAGTVSLLMLGYAVLFVNYRGSLGLGQRSLESLPGRIGEQDVREVVQATRWAQCAELGVDASRALFVGGSHSGFLGAHCSLLPGMFLRTVLRNPVTNVATMFGATDIPDWCLCEAGISVDTDKAHGMELNRNIMEKMLQVSPVARLQKFTGDEKQIGKTLLQVGGSDRRVPPQQSLEWRRLMASKFGHDSVEIRWYPGSGHAIDELPQGDDAWVRGLVFLEEGLKHK